MYKELINKVAIVTGSYGDIGSSICKHLAENKVKIALVGRDFKKLSIQKEKLIDDGSEHIETYQVDVSDYDNFKIATDNVLEKWDNIDILVNNAGITRDNIIMRLSDKDWNSVINTNLKGTFNGCKLISKQMVKQKYGKIINISSVVGKIGNKGQVNYVASKAGIDGITKTLSKELGSRGININSIAPGYIVTNMTDNLSGDVKEDLLKKIPLNRFGSSDEVAAFAIFLMSDNASYITGQVINIDGGMLT